MDLDAKGEVLHGAMQFLAPPPSDYLHRMYTTPLHKMIYITWHGQHMWAISCTESRNTDGDLEKEMDHDTFDVMNHEDDDELPPILSQYFGDKELEKQMDLETEAVMMERIAKSTRSGYDGRNITFMILLFDGGEKYRHLLEPSIFSRIEEAWCCYFWWCW